MTKRPNLTGFKEQHFKELVSTRNFRVVKFESLIFQASVRQQIAMIFRSFNLSVVLISVFLSAFWGKSCENKKTETINNMLRKIQSWLISMRFVDHVWYQWMIKPREEAIEVVHSKIRYNRVEIFATRVLQEIIKKNLDKFHFQMKRKKKKETEN